MAQFNTRFLTRPEYEAMGLQAGVEIHQQLATERKLFCRCPAVIRNDPPDATLLRHMRPTLSEMGTYDGTALMEFRTRKNVYYQLHRGTVCTYEMDDTPPFPVNQQALDIALEITMLLKCAIVDELHVSRKQYLDGSIPTGFQRTAIVGTDGSVVLPGGKNIAITQLGMEEDACREMSDREHSIVFRTDRLSIPLVEVVTGAAFLEPDEVRLMAEHIGRLMRGTGKVRRGQGSVRQDVNVSVAGGTRVEIKGVSKLELIPHLVHFEALRQKALLELQRRALDLGIPRDESTSRLGNIDMASTPASAIAARGFRELMGLELQPGHDFAYEISERLRVVACIPGPPFLLWDGSHEGVATDAWKSLRGRFSLSDADALIVIRAPEADMRIAIEEVEERIRQAFDGVPRETRQPHPDGTTGFERVLPGPDRMYPDTDSPPIKLTKGRLDAIRAGMPMETPALEARYAGMGLVTRQSRSMALSPARGAFEKGVSLGLDPRRLAFALLERLKGVRRKVGSKRQEPAVAEALVGMLADGSLAWEAFCPAAEALFLGKSPAEVLAQMPSPMDVEVRDLMLSKLPMDAPLDAAAIGTVMRALGPNLSAKRVADLHIHLASER